MDSSDRGEDEADDDDASLVRATGGASEAKCGVRADAAGGFVVHCRFEGKPRYAGKFATKCEARMKYAESNALFERYNMTAPWTDPRLGKHQRMRAKTTDAGQGDPDGEDEERGKKRVEVGARGWERTRIRRRTPKRQEPKAAGAARGKGRSGRGGEQGRENNDERRPMLAGRQMRQQEQRGGGQAREKGQDQTELVEVRTTTSGLEDEPGGGAAPQVRVGGWHTLAEVRGALGNARMGTGSRFAKRNSNAHIPVADEAKTTIEEMTTTSGERFSTRTLWVVEVEGNERHEGECWKQIFSHEQLDQLGPQQQGAMKAASLAELMRSVGITEAYMRQTAPNMLHVENNGQGGAKMVAIDELESLYADWLVGGHGSTRGRHAAGGDGRVRDCARGGRGEIREGGKGRGRGAGGRGRQSKPPPPPKEINGGRKRKAVSQKASARIVDQQTFGLADQNTDPCSRSEPTLGAPVARAPPRAFEGFAGYKLTADGAPRQDGGRQCDSRRQGWRSNGGPRRASESARRRQLGADFGGISRKFAARLFRYATGRAKGDNDAKSGGDAWKKGKTNGCDKGSSRTSRGANLEPDDRFSKGSLTADRQRALEQRGAREVGCEDCVI